MRPAAKGQAGPFQFRENPSGIASAGRRSQRGPALPKARERFCVLKGTPLDEEPCGVGIGDGVGVVKIVGVQLLRDILLRSVQKDLGLVASWFKTDEPCAEEDQSVGGLTRGPRG